MSREPEDISRPEYQAAIVQAQIVLLLLAVGIQLFLLTVTVDRFLAGQTSGIAGLAVASAITLLTTVGIWRAYS